MYNSDCVGAAFSLDWDNIVTAVSIQSDVKFVDLNLSNTSDGRSEMVLQAIGREAEKSIDKPVISNDSEKSLLVVERICSNDFGCGIRNNKLKAESGSSSLQAAPSIGSIS